MNTIELKQGCSYIIKRKTEDNEDSKYKCILVKYISDNYIIYLEDKYCSHQYEQTTSLKRFHKLYSVEEEVSC